MYEFILPKQSQAFLLGWMGKAASSVKMDGNRGLATVTFLAMQRNHLVMTKERGQKPQNMTSALLPWANTRPCL